MKTRIAIVLLTAVSVCAQVKVKGNATFKGSIQFNEPTQYTHIWAFSPPLSGTDNTTFVTDVMRKPTIDGVSLSEVWSNIETVIPDSTACGSTATDLCQPDPMLPGTYHHYAWTTNYDNSTPPLGIFPWFGTFGGTTKLVNLLMAGASGGNQNQATPHYVTSSWWYSQFSSP